MWDGKERRQVNLTTNLPKLKELASKLTTIDFHNGYKTYKAGEGTAFSWTIFRSGNDILTQRWFMSSGCEWKPHNHVGIEIIFVYSGKVFININGEQHILNAGDIIRVNPGVSHYAKYPIDTKAIVITSPIEEEYA